MKKLERELIYAEFQSWKGQGINAETIDLVLRIYESRDQKLIAAFHLGQWTGYLGRAVMERKLNQNTFKEAPQSRSKSERNTTCNTRKSEPKAHYRKHVTKHSE